MERGERQMFSVEITNYEDYQDISTGHSYTLYNISVEAKSLDKKWIVAKRYKHFKYLYATLKTEYPNNTELNAVHFPRKSMFHTFSEQTKIKRKQNFEELLKAALHIYPMPLCLEDFLDIVDKCGRSYSHSILLDNSSSSHLDKPLPYTYTSPVKRSKLENDSSSTTSCANDHMSSADYENKSALNDVLNNEDEKWKLTSLLYSTFTITTVTYIVFILLGVIDIEGCSFGRLVFTAASLGSTVSLFRISLIKRDIRRRQAFIREFKTALKAC